MMIASVSKQIHADLAHQHGFLGEGIGIAYLDTGLFPHKDFALLVMMITDTELILQELLLLLRSLILTILASLQNLIL